MVTPSISLSNAVEGASPSFA